MLDEVNEYVEDAIKGSCCGYHGKLEAAKTELITKGWLEKVNSHLATQGLIADLEAYWVYNGQSSTQHLELRVFTMASETGSKLSA